MQVFISLLQVFIGTEAQANLADVMGMEQDNNFYSISSH